VVAYVAAGISKVRCVRERARGKRKAHMVSGNSLHHPGVPASSGRVFTWRMKFPHGPSPLLSVAGGPGNSDAMPRSLAAAVHHRTSRLRLSIAGPISSAVDQDVTNLWVALSGSSGTPALGPSRASRASIIHPLVVPDDPGTPGAGGYRAAALARVTPTFRARRMPRWVDETRGELPKLFFSSAKGLAGARDSYDMPSKC